MILIDHREVTPTRMLDRKWKEGVEGVKEGPPIDLFEPLLTESIREGVSVFEVFLSSCRRPLDRLG